MKDKVILVEILLEKIEEFGRTNIELYKLKAIDKATNVSASLATGIAIFIMIALFFLLLTLGLSLYLGEVFGKIHYGFFAVAGFYFLIALIIFIFRKPLSKSFNNYLINKIFKEKEHANH
jgi:hypothetical protein